MKKYTILCLCFLFISCFTEPKKDIISNDNYSVESQVAKETALEVNSDTVQSVIKEEPVQIKVQKESKFSLSELMEIVYYNSTDFDKHVRLKGYDFYEENTSDFATAKSYTFLTNAVNISYISKFNYLKTGKYMVSYQSKNEEYYSSIKTDINNIGFIYVDSEENTTSIFTNYKKDSYELSITQSKNALNKSYEISITVNK